MTLVSCDDSIIVSDATYIVTNSTDSLVCADTNATLMEAVSFGVKGVFMINTTHVNTC